MTIHLYFQKDVSYQGNIHMGNMEMLPKALFINFGLTTSFSN